MTRASFKITIKTDNETETQTYDISEPKDWLSHFSRMIKTAAHNKTVTFFKLTHNKYRPIAKTYLNQDVVIEFYSEYYYDIFYKAAREARFGRYPLKKAQMRRWEKWLKIKRSFRPLVNSKG